MEIFNATPRAVVKPMVMCRTRDLKKDDQTVIYFPSTTWHVSQFHIITFPKPATDGEHIVNISTFAKDVDVAAVKESFKPAFYINRSEWDIENRVVRHYYNANAVWNLTDWASPFSTQTVQHESTQGKLLADGTDLVCQYIEYGVEDIYKASLRPVLKGTSCELNKPGENAYFMSYYSRLQVGEKSLRAERYIKMDSESVTVTAEEDTIVSMFYR